MPIREFKKNVCERSRTSRSLDAPGLVCALRSRLRTHYELSHLPAGHVRCAARSKTVALVLRPIEESRWAACQAELATASFASVCRRCLPTELRRHCYSYNRKSNVFGGVSGLAINGENS
jgi:hypothetical protein